MFQNSFLKNEAPKKEVITLSIDSITIMCRSILQNVALKIHHI